MIERCDCLVLRRVRFGETSLVATLLDRERGRRDVVAKGARRPRAPLYGHLDLYRREECIIYASRQGLDVVAQAALEEELAGLGRDPRLFAAAALLAEWVALTGQPRDPQPEVFDRLLQAWRFLDRDDAVPPSGVRSPAAAPVPDDPAWRRWRRAVAAAGWGLSALTAASGFAPVLERCASCGGALPGQGRLAFMTARGGLVCPDCRGAGAFGVGSAAVACLRERARAAAPELAGGNDSAAREAVLVLARFAGEIVGRPLRAAETFAALTRISSVKAPASNVGEDHR